MRDSTRVVLKQSQYFEPMLSIGVCLFACWLRNKTDPTILNPLLASAVLITGCIFGVGMDYETYNKGASHLGRFLTPATAYLVIPLYKQSHLLEKYEDAITLGITAGVTTSTVSIFFTCKALGLTHTCYVTLLPKSITTAVGMGASEEAGDVVTLAVMSIAFTGVLGGMAGEAILGLTRVHHPVARRLALGTSAHAVGTTKALELGEIEGAMSNLFITVTGLMTVIVVPLMANLI